MGLHASGDVVAPKDSLAVESWSLRKNESGKSESKSQGKCASVNGAALAFVCRGGRGWRIVRGLLGWLPALPVRRHLPDNG